MKLTRLFTMVALFAAISISCSNSTDGDSEEPPVIPNLENIQPDFGFFDQQPQPKAVSQQDPANYLAGAVYARVMGGLLQAYGQLPLTYLELANNIDPTLDGDTWVWAYETTSEFGSVGFELRATPSATDIAWELFFSADIPDGPSFDNTLFMAGSTDLDGQSGDWSIYPFLFGEDTGGGPLMTYDWDFQSETQGTATITFFDGTVAVGTIAYTLNGDENTIEYSADGEVVTIFWNSATNTGYYIIDGMQYCWDENLQNTSCSV